MERVIRLGERAAKSTIPVLLEGESGVGKELIARAIQGASDRRGKSFVTVNCGALSREPRRVDPVRPRERLVHRRHREAPPAKFVEGAWRNPVPRRGWGTAARGSGQAAARAPGGRGGSHRRQATGQGRHPPDLGDQPEPHRTGQNAACSARTFTIASTVFPITVPPAARSSRRCRRSRPALPGALPPPKKASAFGASRRGLRHARRLRLARQRPPSSRTRCSAPLCWPTTTS